MYTLARMRQSVGSALVAGFQYCLSKLISRHGKRILFITSLYFQVVQLERLKSDAISKLNTLMKLAQHEESLQLPAAVRGLVWNNTALPRELTEHLLDHEIPEEKAKELSEQVVEMTPQWLRYGRRTDMVQDVFDLIRNGSQLTAAAA